MANIKKFLSKTWPRRSITALLLLALLFSGLKLFKKETPDQEKSNKQIKSVSVLIIDKEKNSQGTLDVTASIEAESSIDIIATAQGTVSNIFFNTGDEVRLNQLLAKLHNDTSFATFNNAQINLNNSQNSLMSASQIADESIRQAEIGVEQSKVTLANAEKSIEMAEIGKQTAQDNLDNTDSLLIKRNQDQKNQAIINFNNYLNTIFNAKDQVASLIGENNASPITLDQTLGAENPQTLVDTKASYRFINDAYESLLLDKPNTNNIKTSLSSAISGLNLMEKNLSDAIRLLDNTVSGIIYPKSYLSAQKNSFSSLRASVLIAQNKAKTELQSLESIPLINEQQLDGLKNALNSAESQLQIAITAKTGAETAKRSAEQALISASAAKSQQLIIAQSQVDNARGQLNISGTQAADLIIKAPISGTIIKKYVEIGAEINPGQKIAQVAKIINLKIIANLPSEDIYRIKIGSKVIIQDKYEAFVTSIAPTADPITKKVRVEIFFNNIEQQLIQGTFVDVSILVEKLQKSNPDSVFIPLRALTITQNEKFIFLLNGNKAKKVLVVTAKTEGALVEISSGLNNGDVLIVDGAKSLSDGDELSLIGS